MTTAEKRDGGGGLAVLIAVVFLAVALLLGGGAWSFFRQAARAWDFAVEQAEIAAIEANEAAP